MSQNLDRQLDMAEEAKSLFDVENSTCKQFYLRFFIEVETVYRRRAMTNELHALRVWKKDHFG